MGAALRHRGPDAKGDFVDASHGLALGHTRLSIVELSERGSQPMWSRSGRYCISYNGEVYNAPQIRRDLEQQGLGLAWRGQSDTEVVVEAIEALGLEEALGRFRGMFAFALWDTHERSLFLVRDRLGIKPLCYAVADGRLVFGSELRALLAFPPFSARLDRDGLAAFLRYAVVPGDMSIAQGVQKVAPGTIVAFNAPTEAATVRYYWSATEAARAGLRDPISLSDVDATDALEGLLEESVKMRMRSDVPFGAFLSGGIDSSVVVALMQKHSSVPIQTFCIGSADPAYDESSYAQKVAEHLGCEHHCLIAEPSEVLNLAPEIAHYWDEPFADSSQLPTFMVSRMARGQVTVTLSGDGGDELFGGYNRHAWGPRLWRLAQAVPAPLRGHLQMLERVGTEQWDRLFAVLGLSKALRLPGDKIHKVAALSTAQSAVDFYDALRSHWRDSDEVVLGRSSRAGATRFTSIGGSFGEQMMFQDLIQYLPDDILTKLDRSSMQVSLEARVPVLDHEVVEFAWRLPLELKIRQGTGKWLVRRVLERHVPRALFERPKTGFGVPVGRWLRGPLLDWASSLLDPAQLRQQGLLDPQRVTQVWQDHLQGRGNHEHRLWALLMFQSWWSATGGRIAT